MYKTAGGTAAAARGHRITIRDRDELVSGDGRREDCIRIIEAGLAAADPARFMSGCMSRDHIMVPDGSPARGGAPAGFGMRRVDLGRYSAIYAVAFGKAADTMAGAANAILRERLAGGIITIPRGSKSVIRGKKFRVINASHPTPDQASVRAARETVKFLQARRDGELVIFLVSGGGSSLLALPDGVTLGEKIHVTGLLMRRGASIQEINTVRKCVSGVKGGRLASRLRCDGIGLLMSDVEGDDVSTIASGPTHEEFGDQRAPYRDAVGILESHGLMGRAGRAVVQRLLAGAGIMAAEGEGPRLRQRQQQQQGGGEEAACASRMIGNYVIARNADCLDAMSSAAAGLGYRVRGGPPLQVFGDIKKAADTIYGAIPESCGECLIFGGETAPRILGNGRGGRNQELVLRLLKKMQRGARAAAGVGAAGGKRRKIVVASVGTDGIDGNSIYAGAITENGPASLDAINDAIKRSDSSGFFERRRRREGGGTAPPSCIRTGPTHTNLMDIGLVLT